MKLAETKEIRGMDSNKQVKIQTSRVYHVETKFSWARELLRFRAVTRNVVQKALMTLDEISAEEMQREKPSPSRMEKYVVLHHYLDYLKRFWEGNV